MNKLLVICGPTAAGKTSLGVKLAKRFDGEIVSADSRQVYMGMDIATGKDLPWNAKQKIKNEKLQIKTKEGKVLKPYRFRKIPVWLLDVVLPNQEFSVAHYVELAHQVISDIHRRGKLPILVGGTGFYIQGVVFGIDTLGIPPDWKLRRRLEKYSLQELYDLLARLDPEKAASLNVSDRRNPRRLIRAIEVALAKNHKRKKKTSKKNKKNFDTLFIGLKAPMRKLYKRIDKRIEEQLKKGAEKEVKSLLRKDYDFNFPAMSALGYREWREFFEKEKTREEVIKRWKYNEHDYARRQMTWFLKNEKICWFDITKKGFEKEVEKKVLFWYT